MIPAGRSDLIDQIKRGFPVSVIDRITEELDIPQGELLEIIALPSATLTRRRAAKGKRDDPSPVSTAAIGDEWLSGGASLALAVPSTIVPQQKNLLINPQHPGFAGLVDMVTVEPCIFDARLA